MILHVGGDNLHPEYHIKLKPDCRFKNNDLPKKLF
jgi:hypothetical protein